MEQVWAQGEATVRSVLDAVNADDSRPLRAYTTLVTIMQRLEARGLVTRRRRGRTDVYTPVMSREEYRAARADTEVSRLLADYGELALAQFARHVERLDPERREALRRLAEEER
jgi:BlaI family transcriptional regulator, penicillinase repressor